jgi:glycosyltransferase involved in cell wall biosynthesis
VEYFPSWAEAVFEMDRVAPAPELRAESDMFTVMFAGNVGDAQDFPAILAAADELKHDARIRWVIVGDGRMSDWLEQEVERRGLSDRFLLMGRYPVDRMPSFFKHASALLVSLKDQPIFSMTIPGKLQSYLAAGIPLLCMLNGEGADVVERANAGLTCAAGDSHGLAQAVLRLAAMTFEERQSMGNNGLAVSAAQFDRDRLITQLESMFADMIDYDSDTISKVKVTQ